MTRARRLLRAHPHRLRVAALAALTAAVVYALSVGIFPYHSANHDEAVYLQQAAMLLEGQLFLTPPVDGPFRPWFFVESGERLYPKYAPVPAAMFAAGELLGSYRLTLPLVAAGCVALVAAVGRELFDRRTGLLAAALLAASPLFLVNGAVFLPYVPTMLWNLAFAAAYLRADRTGERWAAIAAGAAVGVAFFARPYTAVLFAAPFLVHASWTMRSLERGPLVRQSLTAALGLVGVAVALGYNAVVTGHALLFPYQAFAPLDGIGFGYREILGYGLVYDLELAVRSNAEVLWRLFTRWTVAGPIGTLAALAGLAVAWRRSLSARQATVAGVALTVPLGNLAFWGNRNILGALAVPDDGLIHLLGPYYHVDLLVPVAVFGAVGLRAGWGWCRPRLPRLGVDSRRGALAALLVSGAIVGAASAAATARPVADNAAITDSYESAYAPFEDREFEHALVFLPTPYGDWLNHPFQALRNDPGYDGAAVYALQERQFAVVDAFPDRTLYRYTYRGQWAPTAGATVEPRLRRIDHVEGASVTQRAHLGVPESAELVSIRLTSGDQRAYATVRDPSNLTLATTVTAERVTLSGPALDGTRTVPLAGHVETTVFVDYGRGLGFSYRLDQPIDRTNGSVSALTPVVEVCQGASRCGGESAYVPGTHRPGVAANVTVETAP